ncbi:MAG: glycerol-3-phosphate 1-O-acyltransferase PlsY [Candidatus Accumulibacter sp.]|jgi:glycerol-3-phosphate acyltransferase PlsY|uniref:glycerol-3-phosphate 1-O-acyltransferase PlsY n=1 Tax=Accumulibacter sp. TaxID=2053492 RepID=UPI0012CC5533|nr:glycerol-3-phosphate 1-O-acyltransferase PlsY [Accumulibacter sp.]MBL8368196.1 glycerol-3-phosphate 1-O-acyltransferase PlsY [Accumulibacter sp.]MQM33773.1 glycerol-3-phosphate acyltransferase [Candidatus Accumulibacter phosphatis]
MPPSLLTALGVLAAYLLGSISFALVASRLFGLADPRSYGSKNPGATNVLRSGHKGAAIFTLLGDAAKGWLAVFLASHYSRQYGLPDYTPGLVALAVFFGHLYPIFLGFKGGKGVATAAGVLLAINVWLGLATLGTWLFIALTLRYSSLAALVAAAAAPVFAVLAWGKDGIVLAIGIISMALIGKHWQNLQRLMAGSEPKIGGKKEALASGAKPPRPVKSAKSGPATKSTDSR